MATTVRVVWGRRTAIGAPMEHVRTMTREFSSATKAAEFVCDILYMLYGPEVSNANSDKHYKVSRDKPLVRHDSSTRDEWVEVQWVERTEARGVRG